VAKTPEGRVKENIKKWMDKFFPTAWSFMPVQTGYGAGGIPDHVYCLPVLITQDMVGETVGLFVGIEAKTVRGKMSPLQTIQAGNIRDAKGIYQTVWGSDNIDKELESLRKYETLSE